MWKTQSPAQLLEAAVYACHTDDHEVVDILVDRLCAAAERPVAELVQHRLETEVAGLWTRGWQPADLDRMVARELASHESLVLRSVLAAESAGYEDLGARVAPEWMGQLAAIAATRWWEPGRPYLEQVELRWRATLLAAVRFLHLVTVLPPLPVLTPPPGDWRDGMAVVNPSNLPSGLLDKVRALLAKAESTTFDQEAEAFTAKAQELMARHRIDRAVLHATHRGADDEPVGRRITVDDPYADAKATLLGQIAGANGGRAVWSKGLGFSTVFAFADELDLIEELFTSLLVQATAALQREGSKVDHRGRSRTTRFRRSFLVAFAVRIGERLREAVDTTVAEAQTETPDSLLPILAARDEEVRDATDRVFPDTRGFSPSASDHEGWFAGTVFGDQADVSVGDPIEKRAAS